jgi:prepilin-type processing-associated H-X9-DG protein
MIATPSLPDPNGTLVHGALIPRHRDDTFSNVAWGDGHVDGSESRHLVEHKQMWDPDWHADKEYAGGFPVE